MKIEQFIEKHVANYEKSSQTYEAFIQCLIEYMKYYKTTLNEIAAILDKKGEWMKVELNLWMNMVI